METDQRTLFIEQTKRERETRQHQKEITTTVYAIQAVARGILQRRKFANLIRNDFDRLFGEFVDFEKDKKLPECKETLRIALIFSRIAKFPDDTKSMSSTSVQHSFAALFLSKNHIQPANRLITSLFTLIPVFASHLEIEKVADGKAISLFVHFLVTFSSCNSWALVRENAQISAVLNQMCNKTLSSSISEPKNFISLTVRFFKFSFD
ncbi:unnamed protein product [Anisakis simplex]|uniref:HECT-type E3 ubiquitin transferase n=1 Tax=Anisakis simplex TaxID=6269 RepID=A0A0M3K8Z0_ANISI|nr:unnamed protein product [Anisakis simplex]